MILNIKFHEILFFSSWATLATKFLSNTHRHTDIQTDRHFPQIVKSCSGHLKTCKYIKNRKSKMCTKPILSSIYIEESNKKKWSKNIKSVPEIESDFKDHLCGGNFCFQKNLVNVDCVIISHTSQKCYALQHQKFAILFLFWKKISSSILNF